MEKLILDIKIWCRVAMAYIIISKLQNERFRGLFGVKGKHYYSFRKKKNFEHYKNFEI